ncbi:MAG: DUF4369 domain-containing protein, partial [Prevotella sp.]|nr:DUF4369 domain-containing protein [Prevotella sp.]
MKYKLIIFAVLGGMMASCTGEQFHIEGSINEAKDSMLFLENMSLNGPVAIDSVKLDESGAFNFAVATNDAPEFYRLRIDRQMVNLSVDSTETINVKASYPTMSAAYEVTGSENCVKIKELTLLQMQLQQQVNAIVKDPRLGIEAVSDSIEKIVTPYKDKIKRDYIFKEPMKAYAYFALFQTLVVGPAEALIFNPRNSEDDVKVFAAVATSWDTFHPNAERGKNLHNIAIEGQKNIRIIRAKESQTLDADKINTAGNIDIAMTDNHGTTRRLSELTGKVVLLDFHFFADGESAKRIMMLRELYNKYHNQGLEIYQVAVDTDEHFWKTQTAALPWISVRITEDNNDVLQL